MPSDRLNSMATKLSDPPSRNFFLFLGSALIALGLGTWGFRIVEPNQGFAGQLYRGLQLFGLESGAIDSPVPIPLELARWLAPMTLAGGLIGLLSSLLGSQIERFRLRRLSRHHIICGLGSKGMALAEDLLKDGCKVLALDPSPDAGLLLRFRKLGGFHLSLKATNPIHLQACRINVATSLTALTPDDACNLALAVGFNNAELLRDKKHRLTIFTHIGGVAFRNLLDRNAFLAAADEHCVTIRSFNTQANLARLLLEQHPLETAGYCDGATNTNRKIHLILPSLGAEASALAIHAARTGHYLGERKVHFHVVSPNAHRDVALLLNDYPNFPRCSASLNAHTIGAAGDFANNVAAIIRSYPEDCFTVYPDFERTPNSIRDLLRLNEELPQDIKFRILMPHELRPLLASVITRQRLFGARISWFPEIDEYCGTKAVFGGVLDLIAKMIHEKWYFETDIRARNLEQIAASAENDQDRKIALEKASALRSKPTFKSWDSLSEEQRDSNRSQTDHFSIKIRAAGLCPASLDALSWMTWCDNNPMELDNLARVEHERWAAHLWLAGWNYGTIRDDSRKIHDNFVPYDELDEGTKDYDKDACRNLGDYLRPNDNVGAQ